MTRTIMTAAELDAIEAAIAACRTYHFGMYQADRLAHEHAPALVEEVKRLRDSLASVRAEVDRFFDDVMVNVDEPQIRANRLGLLKALFDQLNAVADISKLGV